MDGLRTADTDRPGQFPHHLGGVRRACALFAIGLFLAGRRLQFDRRAFGWIVGLKLVVHPAITWILVATLFPLDRFWLGAALLLSALPTGSLSFVVAQRYSVYVEQTSQVIFVSTLLSLPLLAGVLAIYAGGCIEPVGSSRRSHSGGRRDG